MAQQSFVTVRFKCNAIGVCFFPSSLGALASKQEASIVTSNTVSLINAHACHAILFPTTKKQFHILQLK